MNADQCVIATREIFLSPAQDDFLNIFENQCDYRCLILLVVLSRRLIILLMRN